MTTTRNIPSNISMSGQSFHRHPQNGKAAVLICEGVPQFHRMSLDAFATSRCEKNRHGFTPRLPELPGTVAPAADTFPSPDHKVGGCR